MKTTFKYSLCDCVPPLAWLALIKDGENDIFVKHGSGIECKDDFFVSGVWAGEFAKGEINSCVYSCCSGICSGGGGVGGVIVCTPSHMQESLFSYKTNNALIFSNSLAWLLVETGLELDENYYDYESVLCSILFGEEKACKTMPLKNGYHFGVHRNCNIKIGKNLELIEQSKCRHPVFKSYDEYVCYLRSILKAIKANATDEQRSLKFDLISTISQGYDAPASSALAYEIGCREVMTMRVPISDNGKTIAEKIGYDKVWEIERDEYRHNTKLLEAEAASTCSTASIYEPYEQFCQGKLIFVGSRGDSVWERLHDNVNDNLDFHQGNGFQQATLHPVEHLLRIRSVVIDVPLIGADSWSYIAQISNSDEMRKWSVREDYDRPIARRLVEEKGVRRLEFGHNKAGAGISYHYDTLRSLKSKMSNNSYESLLEFNKYLHRKALPLLKAKIRFLLAEAPVYINYIFEKTHLPFRIKNKSTGYFSSPLNSLLFLWGVQEMKKRYKQ